MPIESAASQHTAGPSPRLHAWPATFPTLGQDVSAFIPWFGEPTGASTLAAYTVLDFDHDEYQLKVLCGGPLVLAVHCQYYVAPPSWSVMQDDARHFLPRNLWQRWRVSARAALPTSAGWVLAHRGIPDSVLFELATT